MSAITEIIIFLIAAVIAVPISKLLGLGSVLGYLVAGIIIGPHIFGLINNVDDALHFSELGVVFLLFIIGLELHPSRLWILRKSLLGPGVLQSGITTLVISTIALMVGFSWQISLVIGICLSLSSTAFALQMLAEKNQLLTTHGRNAFAILIFQDLLVIPVLALIPLLVTNEQTAGLQSNPLFGITKAAVVISLVIIAGHYIIRPVLRLIATVNIPELFSAASLLVVLGTAATLNAVGLSMELGAFLAGVLLADSEFRHELEANIEPFKGLLLGLFFISVGMSVNLSLTLEQPLAIFGIAIALIVIKTVILFFIGKLNKLNTTSSLNMAVMISQGGEFGFVILSLAASLAILDAELNSFLVVIITISMALTPLLVVSNEALQKRLSQKKPEPDYDEIDDDNPKVIIAGFGRFGQIIARILSMKGIRFTALEANFEQVDLVRRYGNKTYFGDATRLEVLRAAQADKAKILILSIVNLEASVKTAAVVKKHFPHLKIYARARNRMHVYKLMDAGVDYVIRETILSSIELARNALITLGLSEQEANKITRTFYEYDEDLIRKQHAIHHDEEKVIESEKRAALELQHLFEEDTGLANQQDKDK